MVEWEFSMYYECTRAFVSIFQCLIYGIIHLFLITARNYYSTTKQLKPSKYDLSTASGRPATTSFDVVNLH